MLVVEHSMGIMVGMLASIDAPARFETQVMVSAVPCFISAAFEELDAPDPAPWSARRRFVAPVRGIWMTV